MSNEETTDSGDALGKEKQEVKITPEDGAAALDFWNHFKIPMPEGLKESFDLFAADPSYANQQNIKYHITKAISTTDHEAFKDPLFEKIVQECADVNYEIQFDRDLEKVLSTPSDE